MGTTIRITGVTEMRNALDNLVKKVESISGTHEVKITELLTPQFMKEHTKYDSFDEFVRASGLCDGNGPITKEEFTSIPDSEWDSWIQKSTDFVNWKSMMNDAGEQYIIKRTAL